MSQVMTGEPRWSAVATTDWSQAASYGSSAYFPHSIEPVGRGDAGVDFRMETLEFDGVTVGRTRYGTAIRLECGVLDRYHVLIPLSGSVRNISGEQSFMSTPGSGAIYNHSRTATVWRSEASDHLALKLDRQPLERELSLILGRPVVDPIVFDIAVDRRTPGALRWLGGLEMLRQSLEDPRILEAQSLLAAELRNLVVLGLLLGQRHNYSAEIASAGSGRAAPSAARRAMRLIDDAPARAWTIGELAAECGASARALQEGFRRAVGVSPMQYLTATRMQRAQQALLAADPDETTVAAIAHAWGFGHLGRFSGDYAERFGEYPSQTLRRRVGR